MASARTPSCSRLRLWVLTGLVLAIGLATPAHAQKSSTIRSFELRLDNINRAVRRLARDFAEPVAVIREHPLETRIIESKILFEVGNYEGASVVLLDLIENPRFQTKPEYPGALLMLGQSMKQLGNKRASARYLERAVRLGEGNVRDEGQYLLIDMALGARDDARLREIVDTLATDASTGGSSKTRYALGKANIRLARYEAAVSIMKGLLGDAELGDRVRFYLAAAYTALRKLEQAMVEFETLAQLKGPDKAELRHLGILGIGRIKMERGNLNGAIGSYQLIPRSSKEFEVALHEMSWCYVKAEQYDKALATIDTLLLIVKDPTLDISAHALRGDMNMRLNDYDGAVTSYEKIVGRFAPIRNELVAFSKDEANIGRYFEWLLERRASDAALDAPLTERTAAWVEAEGDMRRVAEVFDSLSDQRKQIRLTQEIAAELEQIVRAQNRVELFPTLKDGWTRALVLQNQLVMLASAILDAGNAITSSKAPEAERAELEELVTWRRNLEARFRGIPMTFEQFEERKKRVDDRFLDLKRQAFLVAQRLKEVRRQVLALEGYVNDSQFKEGSKRFSPEEEQDIRSDILAEKGSLKSLFDELGSLESELQIASNEVGTGDEATQNEADLKATLIAAFKREGNFYDRMTMGPTRASAGDINGLSAVLEQIWLALTALDRVVQAIDQEVETKVADLHGLIRTEVIHLEEYMAEMTEQDNEGRQIGRELGQRLFASAMERMDTVVLEAERGLIDVAWHQKTQQSKAVRELQNKRAQRLSKLTRALNELTEGDGDDL